jgi:NADP-dependent alcohol dehydrogenase
MNNFYYYNPTKIIFGQKMIQNINKEISINKKIIILYGNGSVKKNSSYNDLIDALSGYDIIEYSGIVPNPDSVQCMEVIQLIKKHKIDYIIALGGGSIIDAAKFISLGVFYDGDSWEFIKDPSKMPKKSLDLGVVLTIPATGSEMNNAFVISNKKNNEKLIGSAFSTYPKFSIIDPSYMITLSQDHITNGLIDTYVHILEQYLTYNHNGIAQDYQAEAFLQSLIVISDNLFKEESYHDKSAFMWISAQVSSGILCRGVPTDWSTHLIGHQITALTNLDHAKTLSIILFGVWKYQFLLKKEKLVRYAQNVLKLNAEDDTTLALLAIEETEKLFQKWGAYTKLGDYNLDGESLSQEVSNYFQENNLLIGEQQNIDYNGVKEIIKSRI